MLAQGLLAQKEITQMKSGEFLGAAAVVIILLGIAAALAGPGTGIYKAWNETLNARHPSISSPAQGSSVVGSPSLSAAKIDAILSNAGSPATGTGQTFYNDSVQYGIDDAYALAWFHHESGYGLNGAATQTLSIGNINCSEGYSCKGRFRAYPSWQAGIDDWYQLVKNVYISQGFTTVESIIPHYAPSSDGNDESGYIQSVETDVQNWRQS
jgi:hypothetical protein